MSADTNARKHPAGLTTAVKRIAELEAELLKAQQGSEVYRNAWEEGGQRVHEAEAALARAVAVIDQIEKLARTVDRETDEALQDWMARRIESLLAVYRAEEGKNES